MPCHKNVTRFEAFPSGELHEENFTLPLQKADCTITERDFDVLMVLGAGDLDNYVPQIKKLLEEK